MKKSEVRYCHKQRTGAKKGWNMNKAAGVAGCDVNSGVEMGFSGSFRFLMLSELQTRGPEEQKKPSKPKKRKK